MEQKYGIQETKELLVLFFKTASVLKEAKENDGKIDFNDAPLLLSIVPVMGPALNKMGEIPKEFGELSVEEMEELCEMVIAELGGIIEKEQLMLQITKGLKAVKAIYEFVQTLR